MVIKGSARGGPGELAHHLLRQDTNESVRVLEMSGVASLDLAGALAEIDTMGTGSRSTRRMYHASINTAVDETLTPEQQRRARERLAEGMGLTGQPFVMVEHVKAGRPHWHVVWSRIDLDNGKAISDSHNYRRHEEASRALEVEFEHQRVQGAHVRDKVKEPRPERGPSWGEQRQAERSGLTPAEAKAIISEVWRKTDTGREFQQALEAEGFTLARGDKRDFVLVDAAGEVHGLTRRIEGAKAKDVRDRMADVDREQLPDAEQARQQIELRRAVLEQEVGQEFEGTAERIRAEEIEEARPAWSDFEREAGAAVAQLRKTMGTELAGVVVAQDRRTADKTPGQVLREGESIEDRRARELAQRQAVNLARTEQPAEGAEKPAQDPVRGNKQNTAQDVVQQERKPEATGGGDRIPAAAIEAERQRSVTQEQQANPDQVQPRRGFWQRLFGRREEPAPAAQDDQGRKREDLGGTRVAGASPEDTLRASVEAEKLAEPPKPPEPERPRPSYHFIVLVFGAIIDAYRSAIDRHNLERAKVEDEKRRAWRDHANEPKAAAQTKTPAAAPTPTPAAVKVEQQDREESRAAALRRLREQEEREDDERERRWTPGA